RGDEPRSDRSAAREIDDAARYGGDAVFHAGGDGGDGQGLDAGRAGTVGRGNPACEYLSFISATGARGDSAAGRLAPVHVLAAGDPNRFGRIPGVQPFGIAQGER